MPRYVFTTHLGSEEIADPEGTELPDADAAWEAARATIRAALADSRDQTRLLAASLVVTDDGGEVVFEFPFSEAIDVSGSADPTRH